MAVSIISQGVYIFVHFCEIDNVCEVFVNMNRSVVPIKLAECNTVVSLKSNKMNYQTILIKRNSNNLTLCLKHHYGFCGIRHVT